MGEFLALRIRVLALRRVLDRGHKLHDTFDSVLRDLTPEYAFQRLPVDAFVVLQNGLS